MIFIGQCEQVYRWYALFDCFVQSSRSEGISYALLEALSCGVPVVTTCEHDQHPVVTHNSMGCVVPAAITNEKFADAVRSVMQYSGNNIEVKDKNIAILQRDFAPSTMVARYHAQYQYLITGHDAE